MLNRGVKWLLEVKTVQFGEDAMQAGKKISTVDLSLRGWPWLNNDAVNLLSSFAGGLVAALLAWLLWR